MPTLQFKPEEKVYIFIDGSNLFWTLNALNMEIDYKRFRQFFAEACNLKQVYFYTAVNENRSKTFKQVLDWLSYNGYNVVKKALREIYDADKRTTVLKGNTDVELAVDAMRLVENYDHAVIVSGDGDFVKLVNTLRECGKAVTVVSTQKGHKSIMSDDLRKATDYFIDLADHRELIAKQRKPEATED